MCLYPRLIKNKRYLGYKLNKKDVPKCKDDRKLFVPVGCGKCIECRKQKSRDWQIRMCEEIKEHKYNYFITFTFSPEALKKLCEREFELKENVNILASRAVRLFLERWRKKHKKSMKHFFITELGHEKTERIHIHGILFLDAPITQEELQNIWQYGNIDIGEYCNERTINYISKYITKIDLDHKGYEADIFASAGIGANYYKNYANKEKHRYKGKDTIQYYTFPNGQKCALPIYYRNHLWTQKQRDELWTYTLDKDNTWVMGIEARKISKDGYNNYLRLLKSQQEYNISLGYGDTTKEWKEKHYKVTLNMLKKGYTT